jgi:hypothetical protein
MHGIIIKRISDTTTRMATKLMACKMLRKCHKEEVPAGVVAAATQCANGTMLSWAPYLLNLFLDDCKDAQDLGTNFHYSWLLILIALVGWREPPYSYFCDRIGHFHATQVYLNGEHFRPQEKKWKHRYLCTVLQRHPRKHRKHMEDHSRGCHAIPRYCKFQSHAPHHVDTGTQGSNQGMVAT